MSRLFLWSLALLAVSSSLVSLSDDSPLLTDEEIDAINAEGIWVADKSLIEGKTIGDVMKRRRHPRPAPPTVSVQEYNWGELLTHLTLPASFDSRTQWPGCVHPITDQGDCLGSWAMAATDTLSDRYCAQAVNTQVTLSPQYLINCESDGYGCDGGQISAGWAYINANGIPTSGCVPFGGDSGACPTKCTNGSKIQDYTCTNPTQYTGTPAMQAAIAKGGPIESCFQMYTDFQAYRSGIYYQKSGSLVGQECVRIIGWGAQGTTSYWIGAAYFGASWGQSGFFYMRIDQLGAPPTGEAADPTA